MRKKGKDFINDPKWVGMVALIVVLCGCGKDEPTPTTSTGVKPAELTVDLTQTHQEMVGFGGALTWYSDRVVSSSSKTLIADLIFKDLGADIIRFKNWYYPDNYPVSKSIDAMADDNSKSNWSITNQLYSLAKGRNSNVKVLLSSWGPPAGLKSNNSSREGTLLKGGSGFMYDAYADYWGDVLDNLPFNPDYISIQNEPTFVNAGWTTCQWNATETSALPDYNIAFDKVYNKIKDRANPPMMIGPESQDIPTFSAFANVLKNKDYCGMFAYHPYNINSSSTDDQIKASLQAIGQANAKPNIMTEFSDNIGWFKTATFIQNALLYANSSGYIYWKLVWATPASGTDAGMVSINSGGQYTVTPYYHLIKHFSKDIDAGYTRVEMSSTKSDLLNTAFVSPDGKKVTLVIVNTGIGLIKANINITGKTITGISAVQSVVDSYYKTLSPALNESVVLPAQSITTVVLSL